MGRCTVIRWAFAAGLVCCCGCAGFRSWTPFAASQPVDSSKSTASTDGRNPFKAADKTASKDDSTASKDGDATASDEGSADAKGGSKTNSGDRAKLATLDPDLQKLVVEELKHESPAERDRLLNQWMKFDAGFIKDLAETHRAAREVAENKQRPSLELTSTNSSTDFDAPARDDANGSPKTAAGAKSSGNSAATGRGAGGALGSVNPWDDFADTKSANNAGNAPNTATPIGTSAMNTGSPAITRTASSDAGKVSGGDLFEPINTNAPSDRPISIVPRTQPGSSGGRVARSDTTNQDSSGRKTSGGPTSGRLNAVDSNDPFAAIVANDAGVTKGPFPSRSATSARNADGTAGSDGPSIQPGLDVPANIVSNLPRPTKGSRTAADSTAGGPDTAGVSLAGIVPAGAGAAQTGTGNPSDSAQPVRLGAPTDVPPVSTSEIFPETPAAGPSAGTKPATASPSPSAPQPSTLAKIGDRILKGITPSQISAARNALPLKWRDELQKIVAVAASEAAQTSPGTTDAEKLAYIEKQVHLRMIYILAGQPAKSLEPIPGLDQTDQEFWQNVFWGVSNYFDKAAVADPGDRATQTIAQLRTAVRQLQEKSKLELRNVAFCQKISSYGNYERFKRDEFTAGQPVMVYAELENFKSEATADGPYRTALKSTIEIFDSRGQLVESKPFNTDTDYCSVPRRDYYISYELSIPQRIGLGPHTLKLTVEDEISQKLATYSVNFTVK